MIEDYIEKLDKCFRDRKVSVPSENVEVWTIIFPQELINETTEKGLMETAESFNQEKMKLLTDGYFKKYDISTRIEDGMVVTVRGQR